MIKLRKSLKSKLKRQILRRNRVRAKISGTAQRPRLSVYRSLQHISAQLIDDTSGKTLVAVMDTKLKGTKTEKAAAVGKAIAEQAKAKGLSEIVFDRGGKIYHGRVKALAEAAREEGLVF